MSQRLDYVTMTILEDQAWIFLHRHLRQIKIMSLDKEFQIVFKKKFKYLIIFTFRTTLIIHVAAQHIKHVDVVVNILRPVS